ncbi:hypothetical protein SAMN05444166_8358 [Singulisphaera sp. GP187]|uniref:hypothetical protein n=1 Tax=Singulisphaera sp. GP187 TaxID=1882752 RepID=UPI00092838D0|nr:hypothetical protein [Singulisphaera sp. GP187]SIO67415.1 hypothetical protein SAMN05444166_8358 [Singulisphaera sp. GP187]
MPVVTVPSKSLARRGLTVCIWVVGFGLAALPVFLGLLNHDVAWLLCAADSVLGGRRLYVEVLEINPPLIVWLTFAPVLLARGLEISEILSFRILMLGVLAGSLFLSGRTLARANLVSLSMRRYVLGIAMVAFLPLAGYDFGQREHLMLILCFPFLLLGSARVKDRPMGVGMPCLVGLIAGVGLALKPHFLLLWIAIEVTLAWAWRGWRIWFRPEAIAVMVVGLVYGIAILVFTPEYPGWLRWIAPVYAACSQASVSTLMSAPATRLSMVASLAFLAIRPRGELRAYCQLLLIANLSLLGIAFLQNKGYSYHFYPAFATAMMLIGLLAVGARGVEDRLQRGSILMTRCVLVAIVCGAAYARIGDSLIWRGCPGESDTTLGQMIRLVRDNARSGSLYTFSPAVAASFPLVNYGEVSWKAGHACLLFLPKLYPEGLLATQAEAMGMTGEMGRTERSLFEIVVNDLLRDRPTLLLVDATEQMPAFNGRRFDYLAYYSLDPRFADFLREYERISDVDTFRVYRRKIQTVTTTHAWEKIPVR